jgi:hypothetical protein
MQRLPGSSLDVQAPDGRRIVLRPVLAVDWIPRTSRSGLVVAIVLCATWWATGVNRLNHTDLWGHLSYGRWIAEHRALPQCDPFRSFADPELFFNIPWLSQLAGYLWWCASGAEGLVFAHALLLTLTAACLILAMAGRGCSAAWAAVAAVAFYVLCLPIVGTLRPQVLGMVAFAATLWAMARLPDHKDPLVWLPMLFALWANLHGSFVMGLAALGAVAVGNTWDLWREHVRHGTPANRGKSTHGLPTVELPAFFGKPCSAGDAPQAVAHPPVLCRAWVALLLSAAASCLNPHGLHLLTTVAEFSTTANLEMISEWRRTSALSLTGGLLLTSIALAVVLARLSPQRVTTSDLLLLLGFGGLAAGTMRMLVWWALVWPWFAIPHAAAIWRRSGKPQSDDLPVVDPACPAGPLSGDETSHDTISAAASEIESSLDVATTERWRTLMLVVIVLLTAIWSRPSLALLTGRHRPDRAIFSPDTPYAVAEELVKRHTAGRIVAPMDWADYLIWRTGGAVEPMVYSHVHLCSAAMWNDFTRIQSGEYDWFDLTLRYQMRYVLINRAQQPALLAAVGREIRCRVCYEDQQAVLAEVSAARE